jgi:hypothetical protein
VLISSTSSSESRLLTNTRQFLFEEGLVAGTEYALKVRARNFFTHYYSRHEEAPWSASLTVYSSDLPQPVVSLNFIDRTKTDATI